MPALPRVALASLGVQGSRTVSFREWDGAASRGLSSETKHRALEASRGQLRKRLIPRSLSTEPREAGQRDRSFWILGDETEVWLDGALHR